jgi:SnoaL-like domain
MSEDPVVRWLRDCEELRRLPQRYARAVDARDVDAIAVLFHPSGMVEGARGALSTADYVETFRGPPSFPGSMHVLGSPLIDLEVGADAGRTDTYAVVYQLGDTDAGQADVTLGVRYLDQVERAGAGWLIRHRRAEMRWMR